MVCDGRDQFEVDFIWGSLPDMLPVETDMSLKYRGVPEGLVDMGNRPPEKGVFELLLPDAGD